MNILPQKPSREPIDPSRHFREAASSGDGPEWRDHDADDFNLANILRTLWLRKGTILAAAVLGIGGAAWHVERQTPLFTSSAQVVLKTSQESVIDLQGVAPQLSLDYGSINTEVRVLQSRELMSRVADALSLQQDPEFNPSLRPPPDDLDWVGIDTVMKWLGRVREARPAPAPLAPAAARETATDVLASKVSVSHLTDSYAYEIRVVTTAPQKSAEIANKIAELYVDGQREAKLEAMADAMAWLGNRAVDLKVELEAAESDIESFLAAAHLVNPETLTANTLRLKTMRDRLEEQNGVADDLDRRIGRLEELRGREDFAGLAAVISDPIVRREARDLANSLASSAAGSAALPQFDALFDAFVGDLRRDAREARDQAVEISKALATLGTEIDAQSADLVKLRQLKREAEAARLIYESFLNRLKELSVQQGIQQADSRVLSTARIPGSPSSPQKTQTIFRGGIIGLVLGIALVFIQNALRNTFRAPEELEASTGLTVIGVIPDGPVQRPNALLRLIGDKPASSLAESVRNLRTAINLSNVDAVPQVVVVTSSVPNEGKSILASMLAATSGMAGKKVLLVDADLRRRILRRYFKVGSESGLIDFLAGNKSIDEVIFREDKLGLDLLIADDGRVTPADFFESNQFANFIAAMRERYDLIVLDTPPVLAVPDARIVAQHADAIVYAVRWNKTTRRMVQTGLDLLRQVNLKVTGLALTRINPKRMDLYGYYGYGYRGGSLKKYYSN